MVTFDPFDHFEHYSQKQKKEHFSHLIQIAKGDGDFGASEEAMLIRIGKKMHFTDEEINKFLNSEKVIPFSPHLELEKRFEQFYDIVLMVLADNKIEEKEMKLVRRFAVKLGFDEKEIPLMLEIVLKGIEEEKDEEDLFKEYKRKRKNN